MGRHNRNDRSRTLALCGFLALGTLDFRMTQPRGPRPMSEFDPSQPAILHDALNDVFIEWTGEHQDSFTIFARHQPDGTVEWDGRVLDGWGNVLRGWT
jgi:hypothetical protein